MKTYEKLRVDIEEKVHHVTKKKIQEFDHTVARMMINNLMSKYKKNDVVEPEKKIYEFAFPEAEDKSLIQITRYVKTKENLINLLMVLKNFSEESEQGSDKCNIYFKLYDLILSLYIKKDVSPEFGIDCFGFTCFRVIYN